MIPSALTGSESGDTFGSLGLIRLVALGKPRRTGLRPARRRRAVRARRTKDARTSTHLHRAWSSAGSITSSGGPWASRFARRSSGRPSYHCGDSCFATRQSSFSHCGVRALVQGNNASAQVQSAARGLPQRNPFMATPAGSRRKAADHRWRKEMRPDGPPGTATPDRPRFRAHRRIPQASDSARIGHGEDRSGATPGPSDSACGRGFQPGQVAQNR